MLTVPDSIKDLLHLDSCQKNIRIHFPNGERSDICNDLIVMDTVNFTESLCSQNDLKFGLCESPMFECETVGVGNVTGATIEVFCEIYCDASVEGAVFQPDIQHYVYQVPYGVFVIQAATRQADMIHRKITAYNILASYSFELDNIEKRRAQYPNSSNSTFSQNIVLLLSENTQSNLFNGTETELETESNISSWSTHREVSIYGRTTIDYSVRYRAIKITKDNQGYLYHAEVDSDGYLERGGSIEYTRLVNSFEFEQWGWPVDPFVSVSSMHRGYPRGPKAGKYLYPEMSMINANDNNRFFVTNPTYPNEGLYYRVLYKEDWVETVDYSGQVIGRGETIYCDPSDIHIYRVDAAYPYTYEWAREIDSNSKYIVPNTNDINIREIMEGFLETRGEFCGIDRFGNFFTLNIKRQFGLNPESNLYPDSGLHPQSVIGGRLLPQDYQSCWYDDDYIKPYGKIEVGYRDANNVECVYEEYFNGFSETSDLSDYQVYSLAGNQFIEGQAWTEQEIASMVAAIVLNLTGVSYMPVDFVGRGLPYVEAGDTFEILTKSHDSITTIVLDRTITGEMTLTDSYKSV